MTQRVRNGLGLPAGLYRITTGGNPTVYVPNGITADGVESIVYANVIPVSVGYDWVFYDAESGVYVKEGNPNPSPTHYNNETAIFFDDVLRQIFDGAQPTGDFPYSIVTSETRVNIVENLETLKADFEFS